MTQDRSHPPDLYPPEKMLKLIRECKEYDKPTDLVKWGNRLLIDIHSFEKGHCKPYMYCRWREVRYANGCFGLVIGPFESAEEMKFYFEEFKSIAGKEYKIDENDCYKEDEECYEEEMKKKTVAEYVDNKHTVGHICYNGTIKSYQSVLCSCCTPSSSFFPVHVDLTAFTQEEREQWEELARKIFISREDLMERGI